jgi:hypothetical protein
MFMRIVLAVLTGLAWATMAIATSKLWGITGATAHIAFIVSLATMPIPALTYYTKRPPVVTASAAYTLVIVLLGVIEALRPSIH